jgi:MFS transporter, FSR family, fosmidomycin resistance protein
MAEAVLTTAAAPIEAGGRNRFAATIILGHALKHVYISALAGGLMPEIKAGLSLTATQVGTLASAQQFAGWGSTMTAGYLGDRFTRWTAVMLSTSLGLTGIAYFVLGIAASYSVLLPAMLFVGLGPSLYHPPAIGALSRRFVSQRALVISLHGAGGSLGEALGPLTAAGMLALLYWRDVLQVSMIPALIAAFAMWRLLRNDNFHSEEGTTSLKQYSGAFLKVLHKRPVVMLCAATAFRTVGQAGTVVFLPIYLREDLGYSAGLVGVYLAMAQIVGIGSQPVMGFLADRVGYKPVLIPALLAMALLLLLIPAADGKLQLAVVILLLGTFLFSLHAILISAASELVEESMQSTIVSLIYASSFVGALSPTLAGVLADEHGLQSTFILAAGLVVCSAITLALTKLPPAKRIAV